MANKADFDRKTVAAVVDDLVAAGLIRQAVFKDKTATQRSGVSISWTKQGTKVVAGYAQALYSVRKIRKRNVDALNWILGISAADYRPPSFVDPEN